MTKNIKINGHIFNDVDTIRVENADVPGEYVYFLDTTVTDNAAAAVDIASGKTGYVNGNLIIGTRGPTTTREDFFAQRNQQIYSSSVLNI